MTAARGPDQVAFFFSHGAYAHGGQVIVVGQRCTREELSLAF